MNHIRSFFKGKGFYWALSLCIVIAALCSFFAIKKIVNAQQTGEVQQQQEGTEQWDLPGTQVENKVDDMPIKATPAPTATAKPKASPAPSAASDSSSGQSAVPSPLPEQDEPAAVPEPSFVWPVDGQIMQEYSGDELVYNETLKDWRTHNGVDIKCAAGSEVKSAKAGKVTAVYDGGVWGQVVEIDDGKITWRYCGMDADSIQVKADDKVTMGQSIGKLGETSAEAGMEAHLHLETLESGNYKDPALYLG